jgi:hypothetical protein
MATLSFHRPARDQAAAPAGVAAPAYWLSGALAVATAAATALTLLVPGVLRGPAAMNGSAAGTAAVLLALVLPVLVVAMYAASRGSIRGEVVWLGALAPILYDSVLFFFATPFNRLFVLYVAMGGLAIWSVITLLHGIDLRALVRAVTPSLHRRTLAVAIWAVALLNAAAWLRLVVPAVLSGGTPAFLAGTDLPTSPVYVQDLTFWIPLMAVAGAWLWRSNAWGYLLTGALFVFGVVEGVSIAVDQWVGATADPASPAVSMAIVPAFAMLAAVMLVPTILFLRGLRGRN